MERRGQQGGDHKTTQMPFRVTIREGPGVGHPVRHLLSFIRSSGKGSRFRCCLIRAFAIEGLPFTPPVPYHDIPEAALPLAVACSYSNRLRFGVIPRIHPARPAGYRKPAGYPCISCRQLVALSGNAVLGLPDLFFLMPA